VNLYFTCFHILFFEKIANSFQIYSNLKEQSLQKMQQEIEYLKHKHDRHFENFQNEEEKNTQNKLELNELRKENINLQNTINDHESYADNFNAHVKAKLKTSLIEQDKYFESLQNETNKTLQKDWELKNLRQKYNKLLENFQNEKDKNTHKEQSQPSVDQFSGRKKHVYTTKRFTPIMFS
jgi:hypothetical protein